MREKENVSISVCVRQRECVRKRIEIRNRNKVREKEKLVRGEKYNLRKRSRRLCE